jgi:DUF1680 family protein
VTADPRVDAVRGCVAIERGPLVYCLEGVDHPGGGLDDIVIDPGRPLAEEQRPELLDGVVTVTAGGHRRALPDDEWWPYRAADTVSAADAAPATGTVSAPDTASAAGTVPAAARDAETRDGQLTLTAVPYYAWANRQDGAMRVWIPTR